jgi:hypothetical protein
MKNSLENWSVVDEREPLAHGENHPPDVENDRLPGYLSLMTLATAAHRVARPPIRARFRITGELFLSPLNNSPEKVTFRGQNF